MSVSENECLSGANPIKWKKKWSSFMKRTMSSCKEATKSDAGAGFAPECTHCAGKNLNTGKDGLSIVCPYCAKDA